MQQPVVVHDLAKVAPSHIDEDAIVGKKVADVLTGRGMHLVVHQVGDMPPCTVEEVLHWFHLSVAISYVSNAHTTWIESAEVAGVGQRCPVLGRL
jgi:hypothetical protein